MNLRAPIYFSTGLTEKANHYYKLFITWTNQKIRKTFVQRNMFEFKHIKAFDRAFADNPGPMVGTLHAGRRLWGGAQMQAPDLPSYRSCLPPQGCYTQASPSRYSASGRGMRRTW